ncbi:MAG: DsrE family protein [Wenzhouxiangella sp.]|nr:DsrE family protein [Wenzhouxiangella sp.]MCH8479421.1 DsrE family protein [Wenzhouxiangella sp.]
MPSEYSAITIDVRSTALILLRARPGSGNAHAALQAVTRLRSTGSETVSVFLHGPAVDWALPEHSPTWQDLRGDSPLSLELCHAAWQRRHGDRQPEVFERSSLIRFWSQALTAGQLLCFGDRDE